MTRRVLVLLFAVAILATSVSPASGAPKWTKAANATIHPGVNVSSETGGCTTNFVFYDKKYVYIGTAAHCTTTMDIAENWTGAYTGCTAPLLPMPTPVELDGANSKGYVVYNSWHTMQKVGERRATVCDGNDFALVRINTKDRPQVNPSLPSWGGPRGLDTNGAELGERVYAYGYSSLRGGAREISPMTGVSTGAYNDGFSTGMYTASPGVPGDSGSAVLSENGAALGVLVTLNYTPPGSNGVADLDMAMRYMKKHTNAFDGVKLANGTQAFEPLP